MQYEFSFQTLILGTYDLQLPCRNMELTEREMHDTNLGSFNVCGVRKKIDIDHSSGNLVMSLAHYCLRACQMCSCVGSLIHFKLSGPLASPSHDYRPMNDIWGRGVKKWKQPIVQFA